MNGSPEFNIKSIRESSKDWQGLVIVVMLRGVQFTFVQLTYKYSAHSTNIFLFTLL
jgi:hypothetical protein